MSRWSRAAAWLVGACILSAGAVRALGAQSIAIAVSSLKADSMPPAPVISVDAFPGPPQFGPYTVSLELFTDPGYRQAPFYAQASSDLNATFTIDSLLPERTKVYFRARLFDRFGDVRAEAYRNHTVMAWLQLIEPRQVPLENLTTRKPRFVWASPPITLPPGLWEYDLEVFNTATGRPAASALGIGATSWVFPDSLEANTSYFWRVRARGKNNRGSGEVVVRSTGTFVIGSADRPTSTLFYQNFPNPFGRGQRQAVTCFWFDLARPTNVRLTIYDLRLHKVRSIIPGVVDGNLSAGAYGRQNVDEQIGCDMRYSWDGRDDSGRDVPPGIYIAEFQGDGLRMTRKLMFRGR